MIDLKRVLAAKPKDKPIEELGLLVSPFGEQALDDIAQDRIPRAEHPRPQFRRDAYRSLNGRWTCAFVPFAYDATEDAQHLVAAAQRPAEISTPIVVPFSPECELSLVGRQLQPDEALWYRGEFAAPNLQPGERCLLHFQAVDDTCAVWCNGVLLGTHQGGYLPFSFDITGALQGQQDARFMGADVRSIGADVFCVELCVVDPSEQGVQMRGKQTLGRSDLWYTAQSGIWQPVWLETVPAAHIVQADITADARMGVLQVDAQVEGAGVLQVEVFSESGACSAGAVPAEVAPREPIAKGGAHSCDGRAHVDVQVEHPHVWSPDDPYLYSVELRFIADSADEAGIAGIADSTADASGAESAAAMDAADAARWKGAADAAAFIDTADSAASVHSVDAVHSYCAFRTAEVRADATGAMRFFLNGEPLFLRGVLDQGYWPESHMTAPTDDAFVFDIQQMRACGFNMLRKHIKVESDRFYYHCDRLGMLVWQDMVTGGGTYEPLHTMYVPTLFSGSWGAYSDTRPAHWQKLSAGSERYRLLWTQHADGTVQHLRNHPCIVTWVLFNEAWGQFCSAQACERVRLLDPTRPVEAVSGWYDQGAGDYYGVHNYFRDMVVFPDRKGARLGHPRAQVTCEFGGLVLNVAGHAQLPRSFGYDVYEDLPSWQHAVRALLQKMDGLEPEGLAGYVYTQLSDIEEETNGVLTYDRCVNKLLVAPA